jgi:hypothetical protein
MDYEFCETHYQVKKGVILWMKKNALGPLR